MFARIRESDYLPAAQRHEEVFRKILRDLKLNRAKRPGGIYVPRDLETEAPLGDIFAKHSTGNRYGVFTITDFKVFGEVAKLSFEAVAVLSGGGATLCYTIFGDAVAYDKAESVFIS